MTNPVEINVEVEDGGDVSRETDPVAEAKLIDAAVDAGKSAGTAELHEQAAANHAAAAGTAAAIADEAARTAHDGADRSERIMSYLEQLTEQNAKILEATATMHVAEHSTALGDMAGDSVDPALDIEPENTHWLNRTLFKNPFTKNEVK